MEKKNRICFCLDQVILCGGVLIPFQYVRELKNRGYQADIYANSGELEGYDRPKPLSELDKFGPDDIIIAVWWPQMEELSKINSRKFQFVQGNDLKAYTGTDWQEKCIKARRKWEIIAVSDYAGKWIGKAYNVVPNFVDNRFFVNHDVDRDIDVLFEGNNEPNKCIHEMLTEARRIGGKIAWLGRETYDIPGVETITNPPQEDIPKIYQRAKSFVKISKSEGFSLPILEAMASGCLVYTTKMGGNSFCRYGDNLFHRNCMHIGEEPKNREAIIEEGYNTAKKYTIENSINKLGDVLGFQ